MLDTNRLRVALGSALMALAAFATAVAAPSAALAQGRVNLFQHEKYAAVVVDANTGEVLYARRADEPRFPASITKIMTVYLAFEALATGRLSPGDRVVVSAHAAAQAPSKLGVRPGESVSVDEALRAITVMSANDIAVAMAEKIGGTEQKFAALMTLRAQELGMTRTHFVNANGLPDARQLSSARDIAILSRAVMRDYQQYYTYFGVKSLHWGNREIENHNHLLRKMPGVDGLKTGYTAAAGFNLAASAQRNGKRLIAVVLGGSSTAARDENVEDLLNGGFEVLNKRASGQRITLASTLHEPEDTVSGPVTRPITEMGSGDQPGLKIVMADNSGAPKMPTLATLPPSLATPDATAPLAAPPVDPRGCSRVVGRGRHRHHVSCNVAVAKAPDCGAPHRGKRHSHNAACARNTETARANGVDKASVEKVSTGKYQVQVGVFPSQTAARAKLSALGGRFSDILSDQHRVEKAGRNKFRARFAGFDRDDAKKACRTLSAKGVSCMVIAGG